ncbi:MAG: TIGR03809 family protein [Xanthobacteraceae bacterium]|nr:TIGR03809 family protein [Xanthobacteraceae bacterium]
MPNFDQKSASNAGRSVVVRWRILAQQRMDHLIELYQSGRWKLYHKETEFLAMVQESRAALKVWEQLAPPDPVLDKTVEVALAQDQDHVEEHAEEKIEAQVASEALAQLDALLGGVAAEHDPRES